MEGVLVISTQKKLYTTVSLGIFTLLSIAPCAYTMEKPIDTITVTTSVFGPEHSLKNQCVNKITAYANKINIIQKLPHISADLARDIILKAPLSYLAEHKDTLVSLVHNASLDHTIASSIAYALCDYKEKTNDSTICVKNLVHAIAKNGPLPCNLATSLLTDFTNTDIPDNFNELCNIYFPADILNEQLLYCLLSRAPLGTIEQISDVPFSAQEFEKQLPATLSRLENSSLIEITCSTHKKYKGVIPILWDCDKILVAYINPEYNVLLIHYESDIVDTMSFINVINTKTLTSMMMACDRASELKHMGLNSDCSQVGFMNQDNTICSYVLPEKLTTFSPSFQQKIFMFYVASVSRVIIKNCLKCGNDFGNIVKSYSRLPINRLCKLINFIQTNKTFVPEFFEPYNPATLLQTIKELYTTCKFVADKLNIDIETIGDKIISNEITQEQFYKLAAQRHRDNNQNNNL